jgi:hypothetical protein
MHSLRTTIIALTCACSLFCMDGNQMSGPSLAGTWKLLPEKSSSIDPWRNLTLLLRFRQDTVVIVKTYSAGSRDVRRDSVEVNTRGEEQTLPISPGRWLGGVSMGVYYGSSSVRHVRARWNAGGNELSIDTGEVLETSQGEVDVAIRQTFTSPDASSLILAEARSTRVSAQPMRYVFVRETE